VPVLNTVLKLNKNGTLFSPSTSLNTLLKLLKSNVVSVVSYLKVGKPPFLASLLLTPLLPLVSCLKVSLLLFLKLFLNSWVVPLI
jgi:hypothetical protein